MKKYFLLLFFMNLTVFSFSQWVRVNGLDSLSINSIAVNQNNGSIYVATSQNNTFKGIYYRPNLSTPWSRIQNGLGSLVVNKLEIDPIESETGRLYIATTSGVYFTDNNSDCYPINNNLPSNLGNYPSINCISSIDSFLYIGTNYGIYRTLKSTINWQIFNQNLPAGTSANRILKYHNFLIASFSNNVYRTSISLPNWGSASSISNGQSSFPPTINDMSVNDTGIFLAVQGAWSNTYRSIGDSMIFGPCASTSSLTAYCVLAYGNTFWTGVLYGGGVYKGTNYGNNLSVMNPSLPYWTVVKSFAKYGTALLAGTEYLSYQYGSGGLYYFDNTVLATNDIKLAATQNNQDIKIEWLNDVSNSVKKYELERSEGDVIAFSPIQTFNCNITFNHFKYIDKVFNNNSKNIYYRVKAIKENGELFYSNIALVTLSKKPIILKVSPNPSSNSLKVELPNNFNPTKSSLLLYDFSGKVVLQNKGLTASSFVIDISKIPKGLYVLTVSFENYIISERVEIK